jgi:hypothetical protein
MEHVTACAPHIPYTAQTVPELAEQCEPFHSDFYDDYTRRFNLPSRDEFLREYTPGPGFNRKAYADHAKLAAIPGSIAGGLVLMVAWLESETSEQKPARNPRPPEQSRYAGTVVLRRKPKNKPGYFEGLPLDYDTIANKAELDRRVRLLANRGSSEN